MDDFIYVVEWIEIDISGTRPGGYKVFLDEHQCIEQTKKDITTGDSDWGQYFGPNKNLLGYYRTQWRFLAPDQQKYLRKQVNAEDYMPYVYTAIKWKPKNCNETIFISINTDEE